MRYALAVSSKSGNTKLLGEAIERAMRNGSCDVVYAGDIPAEDSAEETDALGADAVLVGFWTDKGDCAPDAQAFLQKLAGKRVFLFGTAGFGGSSEYFERILKAVGTHLPHDAEVVGSAMCQGKMGHAVRARYEAMLAEKPGDERIQAMIANFDAALSHPDDGDIEHVVAAAREAFDW